MRRRVEPLRRHLELFCFGAEFAAKKVVATTFPGGSRADDACATFTFQQIGHSMFRNFVAVRSRQANAVDNASFPARLQQEPARATAGAHRTGAT
jgi:hypothetical protein